MEWKKGVFISAYCQNIFQEERIRNFVKNQGSKIMNPSFNVKGSCSLGNTLDKISAKEMNFIYKSDEVWILIGALDSNQPENKLKMQKVEDYSKNIRKSLKYFYFYQSGNCMGKVKSIDRKEIFNSDFYKFHRDLQKEAAST